MDRFLHARRHLEGPRRRWTSHCADARAGVSLRAGVEPRRFAPRAVDGSRREPRHRCGQRQRGRRRAADDRTASRCRTGLEPRRRQHSISSPPAAATSISIATDSATGPRRRSSPDRAIRFSRRSLPTAPGSRMSARSQVVWAPVALWVKPVAGGDAALVHYEETEYRARPAWTPDGQSILFISDEPGSNDIAVVPVAGGNPVYLSADAMNEFAPTVSPDGARFAFVSNRTGPSTLYTAPIGGGPISSWSEVAMRSLKPAVPTGKVRGRVLGPDGKPMSARVYPLASDKRAYAPDGGFHRVIAATETHYFHTTGSFEVEVPAGGFAVEAMKGFEYRPASTTVQVPAGGAVDVTLRLARLIDAAGARMVLGRHARPRSAPGPLRPVAPAVFQSAHRRRSAHHQRADPHGRHAADGTMGRPHRQAASAVDG